MQIRSSLVSCSYLTEINVTAPTGVRGIAKLGGPDIAGMVWDKIEDRCAS